MPQSDVTSLKREVEALRADRERLLVELERNERAVTQLRYEMQDGLRPVGSEDEAKHRADVRKLHAAVAVATPRGAVVTVVSNGDADFLQISGRVAWHFPGSEDGSYGGLHAESDLLCIAHLAVQRARGAEYLVVPARAASWLRQVGGFGHHLASRFAVVFENEAGVVYDVRSCSSEPLELHGHLDEMISQFRSRFGTSPAILDLHPSLFLQGELPGEVVYSPEDRERPLYLSKTADIVVVAAGDTPALAEAERLATGAIVTVATRAEGGHSMEVRWLTERAAAAWQRVSIIIPVHNEVHHTKACLSSLRENLPDGVSVEIVVVDDASTDETAAYLTELAAADPRLTIVRNEKNLGFLGSSNAGAERSSGDVIVFLNNDTILLPGWLEPLLRVLARPDAGAVGGRLLYPDGLLQEAGGLVFNDGSAAKFGYGQTDPEGAIFNYLREVDYVSGCLLATTRSLFEEIGGFDNDLAPGFYEDTDFSFAVRAHGLRVFYEPQSTIIHVEGGTAGRDVSAGMKRYQVVNHAKFKQKWAEALRELPDRPADVLERAHLLLLRARTISEEVVA